MRDVDRIIASADAYPHEPRPFARPAAAPCNPGGLACDRAPRGRSRHAVGALWYELALGHAALTYLAALACYVLWDISTWRRRLARCALNVAALLLAAGLVELPAAVGLLDYRAVLIPHGLGGDGPHNRLADRELIYRHHPHARFVHCQAGDYAAGMAIPRTPRYRAECICDANGFRNARDFTQANVVLLGDSFVEGYNVTQSEICSEQLASRLAGQTVCNLALCGYGPQQN